MNIVIFGCDNSGKTTLSSNLVNLLKSRGVKYIHSPGPNISKQGQIDFISKNLYSEKIVIFDRFPLIEEQACGLVLRGKDNLEDIDKSQYYNNIDLFIYCYPGLDSIINWGEREQMDGIKDNICDLINEYNKIYIDLKSKGYNVIIYDFNKSRIFEDILIKGGLIDEHNTCNF